MIIIRMCPECGSSDVQIKILVSGFTWVNPRTMDIDYDYLECDYSHEDIKDADEFICNGCNHMWEVI